MSREFRHRYGGFVYILYEISRVKPARWLPTKRLIAIRLSTMRWVVTVGWVTILGYVLGYFVVDDAGVTIVAASQALNIVYNLAGVNKIAFGLLIWYAATTESKGSAQAA